MGSTKDRRRGGYDRWGYRPTPEKRPRRGDFTYQLGQAARQDLLEKIRLDQLKRQWQEENRERGREGWTGFGNPDLPVVQHKDEIMKMLAGNRISLLAGATGSGKSTQLAQYALEMGYDHIVYLQPRRVTTDNIAERVEQELTEQFDARELDMPDNLVGMAHSDRATLEEDSIVQVMTSAVFKKRAPELDERWRGKKVLLVADEVHEGNIETEFAVATAAEMMTEHQDWSMVLMSATLNEQEIQDAYTPINEKPIPKVVVEGRPHEISYQEEPNKNVVDVFDEHHAGANKTLIFTDGQRSLKTIRAELEVKYPNHKILLLSSKITEAERQAIFHPDPDDDTPTVIVSTSAGQSGITITGVDLVISDGWTKSPELDAENAAGLPRRRCTQAEITQQMGRGGRDIDGAKFVLAQPVPINRRNRAQLGDEEFVPFDDRDEHIPADIYHTIITRNVLSAAAMNKDFYDLNEYLIHKVTADTIDEAYTVLRLLGAVDDNNNITDIGREMDKYPLRPELARAVAECVARGDDHQKYQIAAMVAAIEAGGLGSLDPLEADDIKQYLRPDTKDDFLAQLDYFMASIVPVVQEASDESMQRAGFDYKNVQRAHKQFRKICRYMDLDAYDAYDKLWAPESDEERDELKQMLLSGMPHLLYQEVYRRRWRGRRKRDDRHGIAEEQPKPSVWYRNVLGPEKGQSYDYDRQLSTRSVLATVALDHTAIVAGYPRWYVDDNGALHNVIERGMPVKRADVRRAIGETAYAVVNDTVVTADGRLAQVSTSSIGRLRVSRETQYARADTADKARKLAREALRHQGSAQRELRRIVKTVKEVIDRVPIKRRSYFLSRPALTHDDVNAMVAEAAVGAKSLGHLDSHLRKRMYHQGITGVEAFISPAHLHSIETNMPVVMTIGDGMYDVHYSSDDHHSVRPYVNEFPLEHAATLPDHVHIPDGREVKFRYHYGGEDYRYLSAQDVRAMAESTV